MQRFFLGIIVVGVMAFLMTSVAQAQSQHNFWIGLWEAVHEGDVVRLAISDTDGDGTFQYSLRADLFPPCFGPGEQGAVAAEGPATITEAGHLMVRVKLTCVPTQRVVDENVEIIYHPLKEHDMIVNVTRDIPFYRISTRPGGRQQ